MDKKYLVYAALILAGVILAGRIRSLPGGGRLPSL